MAMNENGNDPDSHRARLLDGMARCVAEKGYFETTIADVVRYLAALARRPVLLRTLFIDILGLGATGLAVRRRVHGQLAELMLEVVNQRPGARLRKSPLQPTMALAVVGGIHELVLQAIEQERADDLHALVAPASALLQAAISSEF